MLYIIIGVAAYVIITCAAKRINVIDYVRDNKVTLVLTTLIVLAVHVLGKTASAAVLMALLMPMLAAYSLPSIIAKVQTLLKRLMDWILDAVTSQPRDVE